MNQYQKIINHINQKKEFTSNIVHPPESNHPNEIIPKYKINDTRKITEMKVETFSGYKKSEVKKQLTDNIIDSKIEQSCYWCAELVCSGQFWDIWEIIILISIKYIHIALPKLPIYLQKCYETFKNIIHQHDDDELSIRNNQHIRNLFTEMITILCQSKKKLPMITRKIENNEDYNKLMFNNKLIADSNHYLKGVFKKADPNELLIPINELCYHISIHSKNSYYAIYWIEWFIQYEQNKIKNKEITTYSERNIIFDEKSKNDIVWILFSAIFNELELRKSSPQHENKLTEKIIHSLFFIFTIRYQKNVIRKRRYILYFCIFLLCDKIDLSENLIQNKDLLDTVIQKTNILYAEIKKNELEPDIHYLNIF